MEDRSSHGEPKPNAPCHRRVSTCLSRTRYLRYVSAGFQLYHTESPVPSIWLVHCSGCSSSLGSFVCCVARHKSSCNNHLPTSERQRTTLLTRFRRSSTSHAGSQEAQPIFSSSKPTPSSLYPHRGSHKPTDSIYTVYFSTLVFPVSGFQPTNTPPEPPSV